MDAKMSEAEQRLRRDFGRAKGHKKIDGLTRVVGVEADEGLALLSELDRLREFERRINGGKNLIPKNPSARELFEVIVHDALEWIDRARAAGGDGT